ncbi:MAG: hypothetical protein L3J41_12155 [Melioribacteraceae bacterium]|nr:hypothetical protein [Melioribacteraceae bacterium]
MEIIGIALMVIASALFVVSNIMILIQAFKKSLLWGFGSLFIPLVELAFVILNWDETKNYVFWLLFAFLLFMLGGLVR